MSTFSSLLSQLQNDSSKSTPSALPAKPVNHAKADQPGPKPVIRPTNLSLSEPTKRKRDDNEVNLPRKAPKPNDTELGKASLPSETRKVPPKAATTLSKQPSSGIRRIANGTGLVRSNPSLQNTSKPNPSTGTKPVDGAAPKPKRGFASLMAKAAAAQEASKAAGPDTIRHKSVEKLSKRDRLRLAQETQQSSIKHGKPLNGATSMSNSALKTTNFNGFKARTNPVKSIPKVAYQGTMRAESTKVPKDRPRKKGEGQDKYGGYASWSDLDDAEKEEDSYESGSDMEEAGYDEMMEEELKSARIARREDEEASREEERLKREKLERKKRLMALNSAATAKKRF